jgi:hypothetical protein
VIIGVVAFVNGVVRSVGYSGFSTLVYCDVAEEHMAHGTTMAATVQQLAAGFAASAGIVALRLGSSVRHGTPLNSPRAFQFAFVLLAMLGMTAVVNALRLHPRAGDALRTIPSRR